MCAIDLWALFFSAFLVTGVLEWSDCLKETSAWDTLSWFAVLVGMSAMLNQFGIVSFFADSVAATLTAWQLSTWQVREQKRATLYARRPQLTQPFTVRPLSALQRPRE